MESIDGKNRSLTGHLIGINILSKSKVNKKIKDKKKEMNEKW